MIPRSLTDPCYWLRWRRGSLFFNLGETPEYAYFGVALYLKPFIGVDAKLWSMRLTTGYDSSWRLIER